MPDSTSRRIALVTGGAGGIGLAIAKKLLKEGLEVVVADLEQPQGKDLTGMQYYPCDVTKGEQVDNLFIKMQEYPGLPDILVCNAGRGIQEKLTEGDPHKWQQTFDVNVMGALRCIRSFVPRMLSKGQGDVVVISSVSAGQAFPYGGIYAASKTALEVIAETLRLETMPHIRVTVVAPGTIDTAFFQNMIAGSPPSGQPPPQAIPADEVAQGVWYAISRPADTSINKIVLRPTGQAF